MKALEPDVQFQSPRKAQGRQVQPFPQVAWSSTCHPRVDTDDGDCATTYTQHYDDLIPTRPRSANFLARAIINP